MFTRLTRGIFRARPVEEYEDDDFEYGEEERKECQSDEEREECKDEAGLRVVDLDAHQSPTVDLLDLSARVDRAQEAYDHCFGVESYEQRVKVARRERAAHEQVCTYALSSDPRFIRVIVRNTHYGCRNTFNMAIQFAYLYLHTGFDVINGHAAQGDVLI